MEAKPEVDTINLDNDKSLKTGQSKNISSKGQCIFKVMLTCIYINHVHLTSYRRGHSNY